MIITIHSSTVEKNDKYRKKLIYKIRDYSEEQFDRLIIYLNSGALVLTIGFVRDIVQITEKTDLKILIISWSLFVFSLLLMLLSHKTSIITMNNAINEKDEKSKIWDKITDILNWTSLIIFIAGIIFFIVFISNNL